MWKVLIADDEPKIRKGLRNYVDWASMGMEVIGEAEDGLEALERSEAARPDVLLVDICMPFLSGLEFVEKLLSFLPHSIVIIVTGHDEFEYAHQALKLGVFDYLLKPVSKDQLTCVLTSAKEELVQRKFTSWASQQIGKHLPYVKERFLNDWIDGHLAESEVREQLGIMQIPLATTCSMLLVRMSSAPAFEGKSEEREAKMPGFALQNVVQGMLREWGPNLVFCDRKENVVVLVMESPGDSIGDLSKRIIEAAERELKRKVTVFLKEEMQHVLEMPYVYEQLHQEAVKESSVTPIVMLAKNYIQDHYAKVDLTLQEVGNALKMSPSYLSRLLRQGTGLSFIDYLTQVRIKQAVRLLQDPTLKIYEVAERVGYNGQHYFSIAFKKVLGVSPNDFRKGGCK